MRFNRIVPIGALTVLSVFVMRYPFTKSTAAPTPAAESNPFFTASALPFSAPPFDKITESDYTPAIEEGMKRQLAGVEERKDVRVAEIGGDSDLTQKTIGADGHAQLGSQNLDRDLSAVLQIARGEDARHPSGADLALDEVAVGDAGL